MQRRIQLDHINPFLMCTVCAGYLVDATTIVECLHSFCRSCIVRHLENSHNCPKCSTEIHKTKPFEYIKSDPSLQEIVYKLVPELYQKEESRKIKWKEKQEKSDISKDEPNEKVNQNNEEEEEEDQRILVTLKYFRGTSRMERIKTERVLQMFPTRYLCCQPEMPVRVLKKFVQYKFDINNELFNLEIWRGDETLMDELSLKQLVQIYGLFRDRKPLELHYSLYPKFKINATEEKQLIKPAIPRPQFPTPTSPANSGNPGNNEEQRPEDNRNSKEESNNKSQPGDDTSVNQENTTKPKESNEQSNIDEQMEIGHGEADVNGISTAGNDVVVVNSEKNECGGSSEPPSNSNETNEIKNNIVGNHDEKIESIANKDTFLKPDDDDMDQNSKLANEVIPMETDPET